MNNHFAPHPVQWSPQKIARVWQYYSGHADHQAQYFSFQAAKILCKYVRRKVNLRKKRQVIDFGCGPGYLLQELIRQSRAGQQFIGLDYSKTAVEETLQKLSDKKSFGGAYWIEALPSPLQGACADLVFFLEVIEHLDNDALNDVLQEIDRLLKPKGLIIVTTPNAENLQANTVICPECGSIFHRRQHLRSWDKHKLLDTMSKAGYECVHIAETNFTFNVSFVITLFLTIMPRFKKNLIYIGRKI